MADENPELGVNITLRADTAQGKEATAVIKGVTAATQEAEKATNAFSMSGHTAFGKVVQGGRAAHGMMMGFNTAMQGGVSTAVGLSRSLNDLFLIVSSGFATAGPFALAALGIGVVLGVLRGLTQHSRSAGTELKALDKAMDETAKMATKLGSSWGTKELQAYEEELKKLNAQLDATAHKEETLIRLQKELLGEVTKQRTLGLDIAQQQRDRKLQEEIDAVERSNLDPATKGTQITALRKAHQDDKARYDAAKAGFQFEETTENAKLDIESLNVKQRLNSGKADALQGEADEVRFLKGIRNYEYTRLLKQAAQVGEGNELGKKASGLEELAGQEAASGNVESAKMLTEKAQGLRGQEEKLKDGLPASQQLADKLSQLIAEMETLNNKLEKLEPAAREAAEKAKQDNSALELDKQAIRAITAVKGNTASLGVIKEQTGLDGTSSREIAGLLRNVHEQQGKLGSLTGDAFNSQQIVINQQVDLLQQAVRLHKVTESQLNQVRRQMSNSSSFVSPSN